RDDGPRGPPAAPAAGEEPDGDTVPVAGRADADGRRRVPADAARQQQRVVPGQRDQLGRLGPGEAERRSPALRARPDRARAAPPGAAAAALLRGPRAARRPAARRALARRRAGPARLLAAEPLAGAGAGRPADGPRAGPGLLRGI